MSEVNHTCGLPWTSPRGMPLGEPCPACSMSEQKRADGNGNINYAELRQVVADGVRHVHMAMKVFEAKRAEPAVNEHAEALREFANEVELEMHTEVLYSAAAEIERLAARVMELEASRSVHVESKPDQETSGQKE